MLATPNQLPARTDTRAWLHLLHSRLQALAAGTDPAFVAVPEPAFDTVSFGVAGTFDPVLVVSVAGGFLLTITVLGELGTPDDCLPADAGGLARVEEMATALIALASEASRAQIEPSEAAL